MKLHFLAISTAIVLMSSCQSRFEPGNAMNLTLRGLPAEEQVKINGEYRVGKSGAVRLPLVETPITSKGLTAEQFARAAEKAYRDAGIYARPAIKVEMLESADPPNR